MADVTRLADELIEVLFDAEPVRPALLGLDATRAGLGDISEADERHTAGRVREILDRARAIDAANLNAQERVTRDVVLHHAQVTVDSAEIASAEFTVTDLFVAPAAQLLYILPMVPVRDETAARTHLDRLAAIPGYLQHALERHRAGVRRGRSPVQRLVDAAVTQIDRYLENPESDPLRKQFPDAASGEDDQEQQGLLGEVLRPAFAAYRDGLSREIAPYARSVEQPGMCWLPGGQELYRTLARVHTTTNRTPDQLHTVGLELIDELAS